jgi:hypothetical protein
MRGIRYREGSLERMGGFPAIGMLLALCAAMFTQL